MTDDLVSEIARARRVAPMLGQPDQTALEHYIHELLVAASRERQPKRMMLFPRGV